MLWKSINQSEKHYYFRIHLYFVYRAQGLKSEDYDYRKSSLGVAVFSPTLELLYRFPKPVLLPDTTYDILGVEDARISQFGDTSYLLYTAFEPGGEGEKYASQYEGADGVVLGAKIPADELDRYIKS